MYVKIGTSVRNSILWKQNGRPAKSIDQVNNYYRLSATIAWTFLFIYFCFIENTVRCELKKCAQGFLLGS